MNAQVALLCIHTLGNNFSAGSNEFANILMNANVRPHFDFLQDRVQTRNAFEFRDLSGNLNPRTSLIVLKLCQVYQTKFSYANLFP